MKNIIKTTDLFFPDIVFYMNGRDKVCEFVLNSCRELNKDKGQLVSLDSKLFTDLNFGIADIIKVILETGKILMVKFSYSLVLQQTDSFTVEDLGGQLWKYMIRTTKYN